MNKLVFSRLSAISGFSLDYRISRLCQIVNSKPQVVYKSKGDTMYSLKQKISSIYLKHGIQKTAKELNYDCQTCMTHGQVSLFLY